MTDRHLYPFRPVVQAPQTAAKNAKEPARLADRASSLYRERHTWTMRAPVLIEAMRAA